MKRISIPLTNVYAKGDYTAKLYLGSQQTPVNLIIDSGSSTLVVESKNYQVEADTSFTATPVVQEVNYGIGGWAGALVHTQLHFLDNNNEVADTSVAIVENDPTNMFSTADGIMGMAYRHLNKSFDLTQYFQEAHINPPLSYPWPFDIGTDETNPEPPKFSDLSTFKSFLWQYPEHDLKPLFTQIAEQHLVANKFSFYAKRSSVHVAQSGLDITKDKPECFIDDPLNSGKLILGGGEEQTDLYEGEFKSVKVLNDVYYNTNLISVQVDGFEPIKAAPLAEKDQAAYYTNSIMDTGSSLTVLTSDLYEQVIKQLESLNPSYSNLLKPFADINLQYKGIDASNLNLDEWPNIVFTFEGQNGEPVKLVCRPENYWQLNTPIKGNACFKFLSQLPNWVNQTIVGLPLITNYYVVFDRSEGDAGVVRFAKQNRNSISNL